MRRIDTHEEFLRQLELINKDIEVLSEYKGLTIKKVKWRCKKCGFEWESLPNSLLDGHGCRECRKKKPGEFRYEIGDLITSNGRNLTIIDREYRRTFVKSTSSHVNKKFYKFKCNCCCREDWLIEASLGDKYSYGCDACRPTHNNLIRGLNDIETVLPDIANLFVDKQIPKNRTRGCKEVAEFICPDCGRIVKKRIDNVCANGLSCVCNDSVSYPNKFIFALLSSSDLAFEIEKQFEWSFGRIYDAYVSICDRKIIIEMHGVQHYIRPISLSGGARTVEEEKENDAFKRKIAYENGITSYFEINSSVSNMEYIRQSIVESGLLNELGLQFENIDWEYCDKFATSNLIKTVCNDFDKDTFRADKLAEKYKRNIKTIQKYLIKGNKLGWCEYDGRKMSIMYKNPKKKPVYCKTVDMQFDSALDASIYFNFNDKNCGGRSIRNSISHNRPYMGYEFEYVEVAKQ